MKLKNIQTQLEFKSRHKVGCSWTTVHFPNKDYLVELSNVLNSLTNMPFRIKDNFVHLKF